MRVNVNSIYRYNPNGWDMFRPCDGNKLVQGQIVRVINLPMAPKANTMGQCYVADVITRKFICMVSTGSLELIPEYARKRTLKFLRSPKRMQGAVTLTGTEQSYSLDVIQ
jgi:hypothetical protein